MINMNNLKKFLVNAKKNTYASEEEGGEKILEDGSKELVYEEGEFRYRDRYFGSREFIGEEIVWQDDKVVWGMNYYGKVLSSVLKIKKIYLFLQKALREIKQDKPFRGPDNLKEENFEYFNEINGDIGGFKGTEKIFYKGKEVFRLAYNGGFIKK